MNKPKSELEQIADAASMEALGMFVTKIPDHINADSIRYFEEFEKLFREETLQTRKIYEAWTVQKLYNEVEFLADSFVDFRYRSF